MPKIAYYKYFIFYFYAFDLKERRHLHVEVKKGRYRFSAKIWIENGIEVSERGNLNDKQLILAMKLISNNIDKINLQFDNFVKTGKVKAVQLKLK